MPALNGSIRTIAQTNGTAKQAMRELRGQGLLRAYQGRGSFKAKAW